MYQQTHPFVYPGAVGDKGANRTPEINGRREVAAWVCLNMIGVAQQIYVYHPVAR